MFSLRVLQKAKYVIVPLCAIFLGVTLSNAFIMKKMTLKALDFVKEFDSTGTTCYPAEVDKESFLVSILIALATGFVSEKVKCFPFCVFKHYKIMNDLGQVDSDAAKSLASRIVHEKMKNIVLDNLEVCNNTVVGSYDTCLNGLAYARCFAKLGVFVYAQPDDSQFPSADDPKSKMMRFIRKYTGGATPKEEAPNAPDSSNSSSSDSNSSKKSKDKKNKRRGYKNT